MKISTKMTCGAVPNVCVQPYSCICIVLGVQLGRYMENVDGNGGVGNGGGGSVCVCARARGGVYLLGPWCDSWERKTTSCYAVKTLH